MAREGRARWLGCSPALTLTPASHSGRQTRLRAAVLISSHTRDDGRFTEAMAWPTIRAERTCASIISVKFDLAYRVPDAAPHLLRPPWDHYLHQRLLLVPERAETRMLRRFVCDRTP